MVRGELTTTANRRQTEPPKLVHAVRGDLDWIVMKALEKDRARRYETANGPASDLKRHLGNEPVVARPPSSLYRFQKMVHRNKLAFAAAGAVLFALLLGLGICTWSLVNERQVRLRAVAAQREQTRLRNEAKTEAVKSQQVAQFLKDMLNGVGPSVALGRDRKMLREILDKTVERVGKELTNQPEVEIELGKTLSAVYCDLGLWNQVEATARRNLELAGQSSVRRTSRLQTPWPKSVRRKRTMPTNSKRPRTQPAKRCAFEESSWVMRAWMSPGHCVVWGISST